MPEQPTHKWQSRNGLVTRSGEGRNLPWGYLEDYKRSVQEASLERVAGFIRIAGMLLQKKVYLFWDREF